MSDRPRNDVLGINITGAFFMITYALATMCISVAASSCAPENTMTLKGSYIITGTMRYLDIEGGCWQFKSTNGTDYEILGSQTDRIQVDGLLARLRVRNSNEGATICMVGTIVELIDIIEIIDN